MVGEPGVLVIVGVGEIVQVLVGPATVGVTVGETVLVGVIVNVLV